MRPGPRRHRRHSWPRTACHPSAAPTRIVVASKGAEPRTSACILLATTALDVNGVVRREMGVRKASFAAADPVRDLTGMEIGGVTPFGLPDRSRCRRPTGHGADLDHPRRRQSLLEAAHGARGAAPAAAARVIEGSPRPADPAPTGHGLRATLRRASVSELW